MKKKPNKLVPEQIDPDSDEHYAYIAGYTAGILEKIGTTGRNTSYVLARKLDTK